jgi:hypothetical protein
MQKRCMACVPPWMPSASVSLSLSLSLCVALMRDGRAQRNETVMEPFDALAGVRAKSDGTTAPALASAPAATPAPAPVSAPAPVPLSVPGPAETVGDAMAHRACWAMR